HAVPVLTAQELIAHFQAERTRKAAPGMARHEKIVRAFVWVGVTHQTAPRTNGFELLIAPRDQLVRIDLMAGVPDQAITAEVESQVQSKAQLHHAQIAGEMGRPDAE